MFEYICLMQLEMIVQIFFIWKFIYPWNTKINAEEELMGAANAIFARSIQIDMSPSKLPCAE